jgi:hypothetical protein
VTFEVVLRRPRRRNNDSVARLPGAGLLPGLPEPDQSSHESRDASPYSQDIFVPLLLLAVLTDRALPLGFFGKRPTLPRGEFFGAEVEVVVCGDIVAYGFRATLPVEI